MQYIKWNINHKPHKPQKFSFWGHKGKRHITAHTSTAKLCCHPPFLCLSPIWGDFIIKRFGNRPWLMLQPELNPCTVRKSWLPQAMKHTVGSINNRTLWMTVDSSPARTLALDRSLVWIQLSDSLIWVKPVFSWCTERGSLLFKTTVTVVSVVF